MKAKHIFEKFEEDSDAIHDMGIGGIEVNFEEQRNKFRVRSDMHGWLDYLRSFRGKTITGPFKNEDDEKITLEFEIGLYDSRMWGTEIYFRDKVTNAPYRIINDENYFIYR